MAADLNLSRATLTVEATDTSFGKGQQEITVNVTDTAKEANQFWVSTDATTDATLTDYINGTETVTTPINLTKERVRLTRQRAC